MRDTSTAVGEERELLQDCCKSCFDVWLEEFALSKRQQLELYPMLRISLDNL